MTGQQRPWAAPLCVLLAAAAPCFCGTAEAPVDTEPHSRALEPVHIGLIATGFAVAGVFLLGLVIVLAIRGRVNLSHLLLTLVMAVGLVVGIFSWLVTYQQMRDELQAKAELLIVSTGHEVALSVLHTLDAGDRLSKLLSASVTHGTANVNDTFPTPIRQMHTIRQSFVGRDDAVTLFYYGNIWGYVYAVSSDPEPKIFYGFPNSAPHSEHTAFKCVGWDHPWANCAGCAPADGQSCAPGCAERCGRTCAVRNTSNCYGNEGASRLMIYTAEGGSGLPLDAGDVEAVNFDARSRPWFKFGMLPENADGKTHWMEPYVFDGISEHAVDLGFSSVVAALNPTTGVPEGVIATDYMIGSLAVELRRMPPTPQSHIYLITLDGRVLSSSYPTTKNTVRPTHHDDGTVTFEVEQVMTHHEPSIRTLFHDVVGRVGSLRHAAVKRHLLQIRDASVLVHPVNLTGMVMLVVVEVPYSDIFEEANKASTVALAVVLGVSFLWSLLVAGLIAVMLSAIKTLEVEMREVAWMQMESLAPSGRRSMIAEIFSMQRSFDMVAQNMLEYKQYLPQSLRAGDSSDSGYCESKSGRRSLRTASSATPNAMSTDRAGHVVPSASSSDCSSRVPGGLAEKRARLNLFGTKLREGKVSVVCCNVRGTHDLIEDSLQVSDFTRLYSVYLEAVLAECKKCQGVVDYFNGDRVCATFNAVRPSPQHVRKAVEFGLGVDYVVRGHDLTVTQGMATGNALTGNAGCTGLKKFHVFSNVSTLAHALERFCREWGLGLVVGSGVEVCSHVFLSFDYVFSLLNLAQVWLPHEKQPTTVSKVLPQKVEGDTASWLFEVDKTSSYVHHNNALQAMYAGDYTGALQELSCQELPGGKEDLLRRIETCQKRGRPESPLRERWC